MMCNTAKAQLPFGDSAWVLQSGLSDEFTGTSLNHAKWNSNYWGCCYIANGAEINSDTNVVVSGGKLTLKVDTLKTPIYVSNPPDYQYNTPGHGLTYAYSSGVIQSTGNPPSFKYGYFELYAKFPSNNYSLWPSFWLYSNDCTFGSDYAGELDIAENSSITTYNGNQVESWYHVSDITCRYDSSACNHGGGYSTVLPVGDSLSGAMHKYSCQWDPDKFIYYFDDIPLLEIYDTSGHLIPQHYMSLIIALGIDPYKAYLPADWNNSQFLANPNRGIPSPNPRRWPQKMELEYFRYYKLRTGNCSNPLSVCTISDYSNREVRKSIISGSGVCSPTFNGNSPATSYTLRATDYVQIDEGTTIYPSGTGYFEIQIMDCPN